MVNRGVKLSLLIFGLICLTTVANSALIDNGSFELDGAQYKPVTISNWEILYETCKGGFLSGGPSDCYYGIDQNYASEGIFSFHAHKIGATGTAFKMFLTTADYNHSADDNFCFDLNIYSRGAGEDYIWRMFIDNNNVGSFAVITLTNDLNGYGVFERLCYDGSLQGKPIFEMLFWNSDIQMDNFTVSGIGTGTLSYSPSPALTGQTVTISASTDASNVILQCGLNETDFTLCSSQSGFQKNPTCSFTNSFEAGSTNTVYCRTYNSLGEYGSTKSINIYTSLGSGVVSPTGLKKVMFYVYVQPGKLVDYDEEADASLFEDINANSGRISLLKSTGELYSVPTCNLQSDCDVDLNVGQYTAIFYDDLFNIEFQKTFVVYDTNAVQIVSIPMDSKWFRLTILNEDLSTKSRDDISVGVEGSNLGQFEISNYYGTPFNYRKYNTSPVRLDSTNNYNFQNKHYNYAYVLPYARKVSSIDAGKNYASDEIIFWSLGFNVKEGSDWENVWQPYLYFPGLDFPLFFITINQVSVVPGLLEGQVIPTSIVSPQPNIFYIENDKEFYLQGDDVDCVATVGIQAGKLTNVNFKIVGDDFRDINVFSGYPSIAQTYSTEEYTHTFSNFAHPSQEKLRCAVQVTNEVGFTSGWRFSSPFVVYADLNVDVNIVVRKTDGTIANPETDIKSINGVFGKVTLEGEGQSRDLNAFLDENHSLKIGRYRIKYVDVLDSNTTKTAVVELKIGKTKLVELVVGQSNTAPVIDNLTCHAKETSSTVDIFAEADIYDVDGDLNLVRLKLYDNEHSPDDPILNRLYINWGGEGDSLTENYLNDLIGTSAKSCTQQNPCHVTIQWNLLSATTLDNVTVRGDNVLIFCDLNVGDNASNYTNQTATTYADIPEIAVDTNNSFCAFTTPEQMVYGSSYKYLPSESDNIPFSCRIVVNQTNEPIRDFRIFFKGAVTDINYSYTKAISLKKGWNYYTGTVDVSNWGTGIFENLKTQVEHSDYGTAYLWTSTLIIEGDFQTGTHEPENIEKWDKQDFSSALKNVGLSFGNFMLFIFFGFFTNPIPFFVTFFFMFLVFIFLYVSFFKGS